MGLPVGREKSMATCKACGDEFGESQLLNTGNGLICVPCESNRESDEEFRRDVWRAVAAPPAMCLVASLLLMTSCIPVVGRFSTPLSALAGLSALWQCFRGVRFWMTLRDDEVIEDFQKVALLVTSLLSIPWALGATLWGAFQTLVLIAALMGWYPTTY